MTAVPVPAHPAALARLLGPGRDTGSLDLVLNLTAIILLLRPFDVWWVSPFVLLGAGLCLLFPAVRGHAVTWWVLAGLIALRIVAVWPLSDNHIYLLAYWCLAVGLALGWLVSLVLIHVVEISVWAVFYRWQHCLGDAESAFYFSGVTYTTLGYGDLVLPLEWRLLAPLEGLTGILMCGLSAGLFFATVSAIYTPREQRA